MLVALVGALSYDTAVLTWPRLRPTLVLLGLAALVPWALFVAYYLHVVDTAGYYEWRSRPTTDLLAGLVGVPVGLVFAQFHPRKEPLLLGLIAVYGALVVAFAKPLLTALAMSRVHDRLSDGVCLQSTASTCGPCAAATVLRALGHAATEHELAQAASSTRGGTLNWLLVRAVRARGVNALFVTPNSIEDAPRPSVIGVVLRSGVGHFVAYLGTEEGRLVIGDPLFGRRLFTREEFAARYRFDRFAISFAGDQLPR